MTIRLKLWLGAVACAVLLLLAQRLLATVLDNALVAGALLLAAFAPIAWVLARLAYHPVRDVTKTTRSITTTGELDRRCFYPGPRDDVGDLVVAVNELLVRYDAAIGRLRRLRAATRACTCPHDEAAPDPADLVVVELMEADLAAEELPLAPRSPLPRAATGQEGLTTRPGS